MKVYKYNNGTQIFYLIKIKDLDNKDAQLCIDKIFTSSSDEINIGDVCYIDSSKLKLVELEENTSNATILFDHYDIKDSPLYDTYLFKYFKKDYDFMMTENKWWSEIDSEILRDLRKQTASHYINISKDDDKYVVNYSTTKNKNFLQFTGYLNKRNDGRGDFYEFETSWFCSKEAEDYYDENWENIEKQILDLIL
jgi:hypothetical protein